jgi:Cu2+-exporting ATPase
LNGYCRRFVARVFDIPEVNSLEIYPGEARAVMTCRDGVGAEAMDRLYRRVARAIASGGETPASPEPPAARLFQRLSGKKTRALQIVRFGDGYTSWRIAHELPGRIRFHNPAIYRKKNVCHAIERELMGALGVEDYRTNPLTCTVLIRYNARQITPQQLLEVLDGAMEKSEHPRKEDRFDLDFPICNTSLACAAASQFAYPVLAPLSLLLFLASAVPTVKNARRLLTKERRMGVDVLDTIVFTACLLMSQIMAGAIMAWCLGLGRLLLRKTRDDSQRLILNIFGKQPRSVWIKRGETEEQIPMEKLSRQDIVVVKTGEVVPVDGVIREGFGLIDQHALTGESAPVEKAVGERVFASTVMLAGKMYLRVDKAGSETASAQIGKILNSTLAYKLRSQTHGEKLADKAVVPTLALGSLAAAAMGPGGAAAVINCDLGTGIRVAAPLGMLTSLSLCAQSGILIKDGRALEGLCRVDTILFDKTGTLTREKPEVGDVLRCGEADEHRILQLAAAAEHKFTHPIARAIQDKFQALGLPLPATDDSRYHVGFGITVVIDGQVIRVGSARFMKMEKIAVPSSIERAQDRAFREGNSLIMVGIDDRLGGAIELRASQRPEIREIIRGLRDRGIKHLAIISGDHDRPTRKMAEALGMDRYFAEVLPQEKARYVQLLQKEGNTVCFVGDGINDSLALKKANVSISLRGASSIATDTAQIVFMEESLGKLCPLIDISRDLQRNIRRSWQLIIVPNSFCVAGVFTLGFGIIHSVIFNNVTMILSLINGLLPLRKAINAQVERDLLLEMSYYTSANQPPTTT